MADTTEMDVIVNDATNSFEALKKSYHRWLEDEITDEEFTKEFKNVNGKVKRLDNMGYVTLWRNEYELLKESIFTENG